MISRQRRRLRSGMAAIEVVMVTAITIPPLVFLVYLGLRVLRTYFSVIGTMISSPLM